MSPSELYEALNIQDFHLEKEAQLLQELETLKAELDPLEEQKRELEMWAEKRTSLFTWIGLGWDLILLYRLVCPHLLV